MPSLDFIYTGNIRIPEHADRKDEEPMQILQDLLELLEAADQWGMSRLKNTIEVVIANDGQLLLPFTYKMSESFELFLI